MQDSIFKDKVIVILSQELDLNSNLINIQDYIHEGKSFIPVFTSIEKFNESTKGQVTNKKIEINGILLLSILNGTETIHVNPGLFDETIFQSVELKKKYKIEILLLQEELKKKS